MPDDTFVNKANNFLRLKTLLIERERTATNAQRDLDRTTEELKKATADLHACMDGKHLPRLCTSTEHRCTVMLDWVGEQYGDMPGSGHSIIRVFDAQGNQIPYNMAQGTVSFRP